MSFNPMHYPLALLPPRYISGGSAWGGHVPFAFALVEMMRPKTIVELGTHFGDSYCAFCQAVATLKLDTRCTAVDTWSGDGHTGAYDPHVLPHLRAAHDADYGRFSTLMQSTFDQAARAFAGGSIDLLHIDGMHTYDAVQHDFETWLPMMSPRGVILLHDAAMRERDFGVWRLWEEITVGRPSFLFTHSFGLGILAVGKDVPGPVLEFLTQARISPADVRAYFTRLGLPVELMRILKKAAVRLGQTQSLINGWKERTGQPIDSASLAIKTFEELPDYIKRMTCDIDHALNHDLAIRK